MFSFVCECATTYAMCMWVCMPIHMLTPVQCLRICLSIFLQMYRIPTYAYTSIHKQSSGILLIQRYPPPQQTQIDRQTSLREQVSRGHHLRYCRHSRKRERLDEAADIGSLVQQHVAVHLRSWLGSAPSWPRPTRCCCICISILATFPCNGIDLRGGYIRVLFIRLGGYYWILVGYFW